MKVKPPFCLKEEYTDEVLNLIKSVTLGSNGARYRHQMIEERIQQLDRPIYFNLERNNRVLGNITICRRPRNWYVRYFAFNIGLQSSTRQPRSKAKKTTLKNAVDDFFNAALADPKNEIDSFYAYIDPKNERSLWMSQNFGFKTVAKIATQTFSRINPTFINEVKAVTINDFIKEKIEAQYKNNAFYYTKHTFNNEKFYTLIKEGEVVAFAKTYKESWEILQLPGKNGAFLKKVLPYLPFINKVINPANHVFSVIDSVWSKDNNAENLNTLFEGLLHAENTRSLIWWVDQKEPLYNAVKNQIKWGLLHRINGVQEVDLVVKSTQEKHKKMLEGPSYITGFDFI